MSASPRTRPAAPAGRSASCAGRCAENDRAQAERATRGHIKVLTEKGGRILGATIVGAGAGELITPWSLALANRLNIRAIVGTVVPYPTFGEIGKRAAISYFLPSLTSPLVRRIIGWSARGSGNTPSREHSRTSAIEHGQDHGPHRREERNRPEAAARRAARPVRQAPRPHDPVRDDRGSADLCAVDRELPTELAQGQAQRRLHRRAGAGGDAGRARPSDPAGARLDRRARRRDEDGQPAPPADGRRHAAVGRSRNRHTRHVLAPRHHACLCGAALDRRRGDPRARQCAARRRVRRDHHGREAAARGDAAVLVEHPAAVADHLRHHRGAGLPRAALSVRAAAAPDHGEHDALPRRPGESRPRHRRLRPAGRDRHRRARARRHAARARRRCCSRRPGSRRSASRCRRSTTICATCFRPRNCSPTACRARRTSRCNVLRPS